MNHECLEKVKHSATKLVKDDEILTLLGYCIIGLLSGDGHALMGYKSKLTANR